MGESPNPKGQMAGYFPPPQGTKARGLAPTSNIPRPGDQSNNSRYRTNPN